MSKKPEIKPAVPKPPRAAKPARSTHPNTGLRRRQRRATINWQAESAREDWLKNVAERAAQLKKDRTPC